MTKIHISGTDEVTAAIRSIIEQDGDALEKGCDMDIHATGGASLCMGNSISGVTLKASSATGIKNLATVALSHDVRAQAGTTTSIFTLAALDDKRMSEQRKHLVQISANPERMQDIASKISDAALEVGADPTTFRCHVGLCERVLPVQVTHNNKKSLAICIRSVSIAEDAKTGNALSEVIIASKQAIDKENQPGKLHEEDGKEPDTDGIDNANLILQERIKKVATASRASAAATEEINRRIAHRVIDVLGLEYKKDKPDAIPYASYNSVQHSYTISNKPGTRELVMYMGCTPESKDPAKKTNITMYHSPVNGSMLYSLPAAGIQKVVPSHHDDIVYPDTCSRISVDQAMRTANTVAIATSAMAEGNKHYVYDALDCTYAPFIACPHLYPKTFFTGGTAIKVGADLTFFGSPINYTRPPVVHNQADLARFISTVVVDEDEGVFVPDVENEVARMVQQHRPAEFYSYLSNDTAVKTPDGHGLRGWRLPIRMLRDIILESNK